MKNVRLNLPSGKFASTQTDCDAGRTAIDVVCCELKDSWDI